MKAARGLPIVATAVVLAWASLAGSAEALQPKGRAAMALDADAFPLQAWMRDNMTPALVDRDGAGLAHAFERAGEFAPKSYSSWATIAREGAETASRGDFEGARRACKQCHDDFRERYRAELRSAPLP